MSYRSGTDDRRQVIVPQRGQSREPRGYRLAERVARFVIVLSLSFSFSLYLYFHLHLSSPLSSPPCSSVVGKRETRDTNHGRLIIDRCDPRSLRRETWTRWRKWDVVVRVTRPCAPIDIESGDGFGHDLVELVSTIWHSAGELLLDEWMDGVVAIFLYPPCVGMLWMNDIVWESGGDSNDWIGENLRFFKPLFDSRINLSVMIEFLFWK